MNTAAGGTWGARAGGLSHPRQRPPATALGAPVGACSTLCSSRVIEGTAGLVETAQARRRNGPYGLRAMTSPTPSCSSPDRGAEMIAGGRRRGRDKPPAREPHVHPAACITATPRGDKGSTLSAQPPVGSSPGSAWTPRRREPNTSAVWIAQEPSAPQGYIPCFISNIRRRGRSSSFIPNKRTVARPSAVTPANMPSRFSRKCECHTWIRG
jgi:hypothetical protein